MYCICSKRQFYVLALSWWVTESLCCHGRLSWTVHFTCMLMKEIHERAHWMHKYVYYYISCKRCHRGYKTVSFQFRHHKHYWVTNLIHTKCFSDHGVCIFSGGSNASLCFLYTYSYSFHVFLIIVNKSMFSELFA